MSNATALSNAEIRGCPAVKVRLVEVGIRRR
jgi:hypothetical protein